MREVVPKRITEMTPRSAVTDALRFVTANYEQPTKLTSSRALSRRGHCVHLMSAYGAAESFLFCGTASKSV
jgi:hypothetical protein